jgi:hypothetical protein
MYREEEYCLFLDVYFDLWTGDARHDRAAGYTCGRKDVIFCSYLAVLKYQYHRCLVRKGYERAFLVFEKPIEFSC